MDRPKYKELYTEAQRQLSGVTDRNETLSARVQKLEAHLRGVKDENDGAHWKRSVERNKHADLYRESTYWVDSFRHLVLENAVNKDGWLQVPVLNPYDSTQLLTIIDRAKQFLDKNRPSPL